MAEKIIPFRSLSANRGGVAVFPLAHADPAPHVHQEVVVPHRHDHYSCFFTDQGATEVTVDYQPLHATAGSLLVSLPGQMHRIVPPPHYAGWILLADAKLVSSPTRSRLEQTQVRPELLHLSMAERAWFQHLLEALHAATGPATAPLAATEVSHHLLNAALAQAAHLLERQQHQQPQAPSRRSLALTQEFRCLLRQQFHTCKQPAAYAHQLHVTVSHLNDTVKSLTGFSVSYFIQQEVLAEAQRLLCYTDLPVQAVAEQLGYEDYKYFSRLFAKGMGVAPSRFRQQQGGPSA